MRWRHVSALAACLSFVLVVPVALGATGLPRLLGDGHLKWASWTRTQATGSGAVWLDSCTPDCAQGKFTAHAVKVRVFRPVRGRFTRLTLRYSYRGKRYIDTRGIWRTGGFWSYYIVRR